jgi:hypothetical protein
MQYDFRPKRRNTKKRLDNQNDHRELAKYCWILLLYEPLRERS